MSTIIKFVHSSYKVMNMTKLNHKPLYLQATTEGKQLANWLKDAAVSAGCCDLSGCSCATDTSGIQ